MTKNINTVIILLKCPHLPTHMHYDVVCCIVSAEVVHATPNVQQAQHLFVNVMHSQLDTTLCWMTPHIL